jgi:3-oxoacyl-[acyl-carrier protein] reductase
LFRGEKVKLKGKVAIVTGAAQGIGRGIALALAKEGAKVVVSDISDKITDVAKEIESLGSEALAAKANVADSKKTEEMAKTAIKKFGKIDILVNNAGIYPFKPLIEMKEEEWDKVIDINLKGVFNCTKAVLPKMIKQKSGNIINIASIAGAEVGYLNLVHYSASKAGVLGFTRSAALELAPHGIRVNAIAPGAVETPGTKVLGEVLKQIAQTIPQKRIGKPEDIANLVVFLASDDSSYITGQLIVADGGLTIV